MSEQDQKEISYRLQGADDEQENSNALPDREEDPMEDPEALKLRAEAKGLIEEKLKSLSFKDFKSQPRKEEAEVLDADKIKKARKILKKREKKKQKWYNPKLNTNIYVQGLPLDVTFSELTAFFEKAGVLRLDPATGEPKLKIYKDSEGRNKGDALISYSAPESIENAETLLQGAQIRPGFPISFELAEFKQKGEEYVPRQRKVVDELTKVKFKANKEKQFGWGETVEGLRKVVLLNMFGPEDFDEETADEFFKLLEEDVRPELEKIGPIKRLEIHRHRPDGVIEVKYSSQADAENCIQIMNGRFYAGRQIECFFHDGKANYRRVEEDPEEAEKRLEEFGKWLGSELAAAKPAGESGV